jgi:hypothetical protein
MEYTDVTIHSVEDTSAKRSPRESTLKAIPTPGRTSIRLQAIFCPPRTAGIIETIIPNFKNAITNVQNSLRFGFLPETIIKSVPKRETATARTGLINTIASIEQPPHERIIRNNVRSTGTIAIYFIEGCFHL